ncbi:MAG: cation:dicarboxylate symporter family transporter, partial [Endozoicomonas sp.]
MKVPGVIIKAKLPVMLLLMLVVPFVVDSWISVGVKSFFYSLSLSIKTLLVFVLPFIVFSFVVACLARMGRNALFFTVLLIATVFISNISAIFTGYAIGYFMVPLVSVPVADVSASSSLQALWHLNLVPVFTNKHALMAGFVVGMLVTVIPYEPLRSLSVKASEGASWFLKHIFIPLLPFFILGFAFKLHEDGILRQAISAYGPILVLVITSQLCYLTLFYLVAARFSFSRFFEYVNNVVPAALTGLSTISSAASMPVLIEGTEKNIRNQLMARTIVPATINIHTIGSAIGLTILSLVTLNTFNLPIPELSFFALFAFY